jgi:NAD(P)-dependent dehydrogenase (short-subunit alcohol dehydrogenase family)
MNIFSLKGKTAIVTGATGLLGREHCKALSEAGANVIIADLNLDACKKLSSEISSDSLPIELDVTSKDSIISALNIGIAKYGKIDILVNNAAINDMFESPKAALENSKLENYPLELWQKSIDVNLTGVFLCSQIIGSQMAKSGGGVIINIASTYGITAPDQSLYVDENGKQLFFKPPAYSVTKAAVIALTKYIASYWGKQNVRCVCLSPGGVYNNQNETFVKKYSAKTMLGRMANKEDYKSALIFLASDGASYMTGANLIIDGGFTAW